MLCVCDLCYVGPLVTLARRPFGDLAMFDYVGPLVTLAVFGYVM